MRLLRDASCFSSASLRLLAASLAEELLEDELVLAVLVVCPEPVVPQAVTATSMAAAAIGRNMFDAPIMIEEGIRLIRIGFR